jgi:hypothetical protein
MQVVAAGAGQRREQAENAFHVNILVIELQYDRRTEFIGGLRNFYDGGIISARHMYIPPIFGTPSIPL